MEYHAEGGFFPRYRVKSVCGDTKGDIQTSVKGNACNKTGSLEMPTPHPGSAACKKCLPCLV